MSSTRVRKKPGGRRKPTEIPARTPIQARSKATVHAILEATAQVLLAEGYEGTTTNRVAERAGVSIGSLYQYFPNKAAMVSALVDRHADEMLGLLARTIMTVVGAPLEEAIRTYVRAMLESHALHPELHRVFIEQLPRIEGFDRIRQINNEAQKLVRGYLELHRGEILPKDLELASFLLVYAVSAVSHVALVEHPELVRSATFAEEIVQLVLRYLTTGAAPGPRA